MEKYERRTEMDIGSGNGSPAANLSNFHPHSFVIEKEENGSSNCIT